MAGTENSLSIQQFKEMSDAERKKVSKKTLVDIIMSAATNPELNQLNDAIKGLTDLIEGYKKETEENSNSIVKMKVELELMKEENRQTKKDFAERLNNIEQRSRINNLEVVGLKKPSNTETDTLLALNFFKEALKADVDDKDFDALHEVPSRRRDNKRVIIVAFKFRSKRDEILSLKQNLRAYNENLDVADKIYVNEQLSPENKRLFSMCAKVKYEHDFKYLWTKKGVSFLRKDDSSRPFKICCENDLTEVISSLTDVVV